MFASYARDRSYIEERPRKVRITQEEFPPSRFAIRSDLGGFFSLGEIVSSPS